MLALENPWSEFTFADEELRTRLAAACTEFEADLLVAGPLVSLGAEGGGTPEEVSTFEALLADFRRRIPQPLLVWIVHHENKSGDVSGAWARVPDALMHVRLEGRGQTKLHWRKARWSTVHDDHWTLRWLADCEGFERTDEPERDVRSEVLALWGDARDWRTASYFITSRSPVLKGNIVVHDASAPSAP